VPPEGVNLPSIIKLVEAGRLFIMRAAEEATFKAVAELVELGETVVEEMVLKSIYMGLMPQTTLAVVVEQVPM